MAWWNILCHHYCICLRVKVQQYFVRLISCMFLDKKIGLKLWLNLGLSLTIFRGTGPWILDSLTVEIGIQIPFHGSTLGRVIRPSYRLIGFCRSL